MGFLLGRVLVDGVEYKSPAFSNERDMTRARRRGTYTSSSARAEDAPGEPPAVASRGAMSELLPRAERKTTPPGGELDPRGAAYARRGYYSAVSHMDDRVGQVLGTLDDIGRKGDTIVIFTADHGFGLGEGSHWGKGSIHEIDARARGRSGETRRRGSQFTRTRGATSRKPAL